jgi:hypothetical protein
MRYCPSTVCPYRRRTRRPVEYEDRVTTCADCGAALVDDFALAREGVAPDIPANEPRGYREPANLAAVEDEEERRARAARNDVVTGVCFLALSVLLMFATVRRTAEGVAFTLALLPLGFGVVRLLRGLGGK